MTSRPSPPGPLRKILSEWGNSLVELCYPPRCLACHGPLNFQDSSGQGNRPNVPFCPSCRRKLIAPGDHVCRHCGGSLFTQGTRPDRCWSCEKTDYPFERVIALGPYQEPLRSLLLHSKHQATGELPWALARLLTEVRHADFEALDIDLVVPVPMHFIRRRIRGINGPEVMASWFAQYLGVPCRKNLLLRHRATRRQSAMKGTGRKTNVAHAFTIGKRSWFSRAPWDITGNKILLVDDIFTTGATCTEISKILLQAGAEKITVATIARAEGKESR